jgi:small multidrug resistance pump
MMSHGMAWGILFSATGFELVSTYFMAKAQGFSRPIPSLLAVVFYSMSFYGFNLSLRTLEISVAYAVWSAVVMALLALFGMTILGESVTIAKIGGISAIIAGTVALSLSGVS